MRVLITLFILSISFLASADECTLTKQESVEALNCYSIQATTQYFEHGVTQLSLKFHDEFQLEVEIIEDEIEKTISNFRFNDKRLPPQLSANEKENILKLSQVIQENSYFKKPNLILFFKNLPEETDLTPLRDAALRSSLRKSKKKRFTSLCSFIGLKRKGFYDIKNDPTVYSEKVTVGDPQTNCYGRCGSGCNNKSPNYTQQCLNHDICRRNTGENLGVCSNEFWLASPGYLWAPFCLLKL